MKSKILLALMLVNIFSIANSIAEDKAVTTLDTSVGNGGIDVGVTRIEPLAGPVDLTFGAKAGMDLVGGDEASAQGTALVGVNWNVSEIFRINPLLMYKCEGIITKGATQSEKDSVNGCAFRAGGQIFLGERDGFNLGLGYSHSLQDKDHGEANEFQFLFRIPLSANDVDRSINEKGDMDFNDHSPVEVNSAKAVSA